MKTITQEQREAIVREAIAKRDALLRAPSAADKSTNAGIHAGNLYESAEMSTSVGMKRYDFDWGHVGIEARENEYGEWVRYRDALALNSKELDHAYAEGRTDESKEMAGPLALMRDAFDLLESHLGDSEVEYEDEDEEREYAPVQVAARFLMAAIQAMQGGRK